MTPQKIIVKIPRKINSLIPFDIELWNTGEYEAIDKEYGIARVLCTDNKGSYPIVVCFSEGEIRSFTNDGIALSTKEIPRLFLRKKSSEELPSDLFANVYNNDIGNRYDTLDKAHEFSLDDRLAILHITYEWEDVA